VVTESAAGDQPDLGVHLLGSRVGQAVPKGRFDPRTLFGDRLGEFHEGGELAATGPLQPRVEQLERLLERDAVDHPQLH